MGEALSATFAKPSVAELVRSLTSEEKDAALVELVREAIRTTGGEILLPLHSADGASLGYFVPQEIAKRHLESVMPTLSEEDRERTRRALADLSKTFDMEAFLDEVSREDPD